MDGPGYFPFQHWQYSTDTSNFFTGYRISQHIWDKAMGHDTDEAGDEDQFVTGFLESLSLITTNS
jgi:hypothetical protein